MKKNKWPSRTFVTKTGKVYNRISGSAAKRQVYNQYFRACAKLRGLVWELDEDSFTLLTSLNCYYCGSPPSNKHTRQTIDSEYVYNGIDRLDNTKGYTRDNTVPSCKQCNYMKKGLFKEDFLSHIAKIYKHLKL